MWTDPPWNTPLDAEGYLRAIPASATMTGMFIDSTAALARQKGHTLASARARYTAFQPYPLKEHCTVLVEVARLLYPKATLREALRRLGRGAPHVLLQSTVGRVVLGSAEGPIATIEAMAKSYAVHMRPATLQVERAGEKAAIIHLSDIYNFLDSHNIGVFEGVMRHAKLEGTIRLRSYSRTSADFYCEWA
jgi:uncharacterized protein (TIGR02265 family)